MLSSENRHKTLNNITSAKQTVKNLLYKHNLINRTYLPKHDNINCVKYLMFSTVGVPDTIHW
jgi:hypothetical protein